MSTTPPQVNFPIITLVCTAAVQQLTADTTIWYEEGNLSLEPFMNDGTTLATPIHFLVADSAPADVTFANGVAIDAGGYYPLPFAKTMKDIGYQSRASNIYIKGAANNVVHFQYSKRG